MRKNLHQKALIAMVALILVGRMPTEIFAEILQDATSEENSATYESEYKQKSLKEIIREKAEIVQANLEYSIVPFSNPATVLSLQNSLAETTWHHLRFPDRWQFPSQWDIPLNEYGPFQLIFAYGGFDDQGKFGNRTPPTLYTHPMLFLASVVASGTVVTIGAGNSI